MSDIKLKLTVQDIETISKIISENNIVGAIDLIGSGYDSGIGYCLDLEFPKEINGRNATIRINVTDESNW